jgi:hypothetical protein
MKTLLYCYRSGWINNALGLLQAGIVTRPLTCPPLTAETFPYERLADVDLIYIALHGSPKGMALYGDGNLPALSVEGIIDGPELHGVVILEGCYGAKTAFPQAFMARGAGMVISSRERTFDRRYGLGEAGRMGRDLVRALRAGKDLRTALRGEFEALVRNESKEAQS